MRKRSSSKSALSTDLFDKERTFFGSILRVIIGLVFFFWKLGAADLSKFRCTRSSCSCFCC